MRRRALLLVLTASLLSVGLLVAQPAPTDLTGSWRLDASVSFGAAAQVADAPPGLVAADCTFEGSADVSQDGTALGGTALLRLLSGDPQCPTEMSAQLSGEFVANALQMGLLMGGNLGSASFSGGGGQTPDDLAGRMSVTQGPFAGATGSWQAIRAQATSVPALGGWGLALLTVAILAGGAAVLRRLS